MRIVSVRVCIHLTRVPAVRIMGTGGATVSKARLNISLDDDLVDFIKLYARQNRTTAAEIFTQFILSLKRRSHGDPMDLIFDYPGFHEALLDTRTRLKNGTAQWHSFDEVFGAD